MDVAKRKYLCVKEVVGILSIDLKRTLINNLIKSNGMTWNTGNEGIIKVETYA